MADVRWHGLILFIAKTSESMKRATRRHISCSNPDSTCQSVSDILETYD
jgi:hypothetical protein